MKTQLTEPKGHTCDNLRATIVSMLADEARGMHRAHLDTFLDELAQRSNEAPTLQAHSAALPQLKLLLGEVEDALLQHNGNAQLIAKVRAALQTAPQEGAISHEK